MPTFYNDVDGNLEAVLKNQWVWCGWFSFFFVFRRCFENWGSA